MCQLRTEPLSLQTRFVTCNVRLVFTALTTPFKQQSLNGDTMVIFVMASHLENVIMVKMTPWGL